MSMERKESRLVESSTVAADLVQWILAVVVWFAALDFVLISLHLPNDVTVKRILYVFALAQAGMAVLATNMARRLAARLKPTSGGDRAREAFITAIGIALFLANLLGLPHIVLNHHG